MCMGIQDGESALVAESLAVVRGNLKRRRLVGPGAPLDIPRILKSRSGKADADDDGLFERADC